MACNRSLPLFAATVVTAVATVVLPASKTRAQYTFNKVALLDQVDLGDFGTGPFGGSDCWGYVSPSGREYALMGISNALAVVEITTPTAAAVVGTVSHTNNLWADVKVYQDHCYVVNEGSGGVDVIDLSDVDNGNVTLVQRVTAGGLQTVHNVAVDTASGYLYLCGANLHGGRLTAMDLSNPANPVEVGAVPAGGGSYCHDAQVVTYTSGPYAGKQIAFGSDGGAGLEIFDVTDKSNMFRLSQTPYPDLAYAHQAWLSDDRQHLYLNDELEGINRTTIFDVSNLAAPTLVGQYAASTTAGDHNIYYKDGFVFEAEYRGGLRVFCATADPINPVEVGWFDTFPANDSGQFDGAWSVYPFFPSGVCLISDQQRGLFVVDVSTALTAGALNFSHPDGLPDSIGSLGGTTVRVDAPGVCGAAAAAGTGLLHYDDGNGLQSVVMADAGAGSFDATFPATDCGSVVQYYFTVESAGGDTYSDPPNAPVSTYSASSFVYETIAYEDDFETDTGWTVTNNATNGHWERGVPVDDPNYDWDPASDADGSGQCYVTGNALGESDIDNGVVFLTSPAFDLSPGNLGVSYEYYVRLDQPTGSEGMQVQITDDGLFPGTTIAEHVSDGGPDWNHFEISPAELDALGVNLTSNMKIRFTAADGLPDSIVEAGVDGFRLLELVCQAIQGDIDLDGVVGVSDLLILLGTWGPCDNPCPPTCAADLDGDCQVGVSDLLIVLGNWTI